MTDTKAFGNAVWMWPLLILMALLLRVYHLDSYGIWHDERVSILVANGQFFGDEIQSAISTEVLKSQNDLSHVVEATVKDNGNGLAYNLLLHYWLLTFGNDDFTARMLSVLFGLLLIPLIHAFTLRISRNKELALITAAFAVAHPLFIAYAQQARAYTMATFFSLLATHILLRFIQGEAKPRHAVYYAMSAAIALLSHYLTISVFLAHALIFVFLVRDRRSWMLAIASASGIAGIVLLWMFNGGLDGYAIMKQQNLRYSLQAAEWKEGSSSFAMPVTIKNIFTGWAQVWLQVFGNQLQNFGFRIREFAVMLLIPLSMLFMLFRSTWSDKESRRIYFILITLFFTQILFATYQALSSGHCISFQPLYASFIVPYAILLLTWCVFVLQKNGKKTVSWVLMLFFTLTMTASSFSTWYNLAGKKPANNGHLKKTEEFVNEYQEGDTIKVKSSMDLRLFSVYLPEGKNYIMEVDSSITDDSYESVRWK